jgi:hypothetical protein
MSITTQENSEQEVENMTDTKRKQISETVNLLKKLDEKSLLLIQSGARLLEARQNLDAQDNDEAG